MADTFCDECECIVTDKGQCEGCGYPLCDSCDHEETGHHKKCWEEHGPAPDEGYISDRERL